MVRLPSLSRQKELLIKADVKGFFEVEGRLPRAKQRNTLG